MLTKNQNKPFVKFELLFVLPLFAVLLFILCSFKIEPRFLTREILRFSKETIVAKPQGPVQQPSLQDSVYSRVEESPQFIGGIDAFKSFISKNLNYPLECKEDGIEGRVLIMIIIEKDGTASNPEVLKSVNPLLDNEALRIAKILPKFKPGKHKGIPVRVGVVMPLDFKL